jgi:shikimate dehydrogenase
VVFGTGGASRAVVWVLLQKGAHVTVVFRSPESHRTETLKRDFADKVSFISCDSLISEQLSEYTIICNTTSAGMHPFNDGVPLELDNFDNIDLTKVIVFDAVFNPVTTKLQKWAESKGATLAYGIDMMIFQGIVAFEYWTGKKVGNETIQRASDILMKKH